MMTHIVQCGQRATQWQAEHRWTFDMSICYVDRRAAEQQHEAKTML